MTREQANNRKKPTLTAEEEIAEVEKKYHLE